MRIALVLIAVFFAFGCSDKNAKPAEPKAAAPQQVTVAAVAERKLDTKLTLPAQIAPYESVDIYPKVSGFIESISVDRGSRVRAGQVIARLSAPELVAQRSQAEARVQAAEAQLVSAKAKLASDEGTYNHLAAAAKTPGVVAGNDVAVAQQSVAADRAQVEAATNNTKAARDALQSVAQLESYLQVRAPFDGVVTQRNLHPGALAGPAAGASVPAIVHLESAGRLRIVVPVPENFAAGVRQKQPVRFTVPSMPGRTFTAPVARVSNDVSQNSRTMAVELEVRDASITPGSFANVEWPVQRSYATLFVPSSAITTDLQRTFVIRIRDGKAEWVDVKTGATANGATEVFGELRAGDTVVQTATDAIRPGTSLTTSNSK
jgi:membrane fusion protein, multidrug efflux system